MKPKSSLRGALFNEAISDLKGIASHTTLAMTVIPN